MIKTTVQEALNGFVEDLRATHGANLASVVLYGSAAAGDHIELRSALRDVFPYAERSPIIDREVSRALAMLADDDPGVLQRVAAAGGQRTRRLRRRSARILPPVWQVGQ